VPSWRHRNTRPAATDPPRLIDLFETNNPRVSELKSKLVAYHRLLISSRLTNAALVEEEW
jgi:hypothetical protein